MRKMPIDIADVADVVLGLDVVPLDEVRSRYGSEAAIMADFSGIYVDGEIYDVLNHGAGWKYNQLRFSIAHEIGHFYMHQKLFTELGFHALDGFLDWSNGVGWNKEEIEDEADEFAGRLLVPVDRLREEFGKLESAFDQSGIADWRTNSRLKLSAAEHIAQKFFVLDKVILKRFTNEDLWV